MYANGAGNETGWDQKNKACLDPYGQAAPAGKFPLNPLGLYDMHGNVWEWVRDCYDAGTYADRGPHQTTEPTENGIGCERRVLRGGSFDDEPRFLRSAARLKLEPGVRGASVGFRCVRGPVRQPNH